MFLFFVHAAVLFSACLATDSIITLQKKLKEPNSDVFIVNGNLSININEKQEIIMNESQLDKHAVPDIKWNGKYVPLKAVIIPRDIDHRHLEKTKVNDKQTNFDNFAMTRRHNAPRAKRTGQSNQDKLDGQLDNKEIRNNLNTFYKDRQRHAPSNKFDNSTEETKNNNHLIISSQEIAHYEPLVLSVFTLAPSNYPENGLNNESISEETTLGLRPEPENTEPLEETNEEPKNLSHGDSELKPVSSQEIPPKDLPKFALYVNYDFLNSSKVIDPSSNENTAIKTLKPNVIYELDPFTYEPVKNRHQSQTEAVPLETTSISTEKTIILQNYGPILSDTYLPPLVSIDPIVPDPTLMNTKTKPNVYYKPALETKSHPHAYYKPAPEKKSKKSRVQNYESATYFHNKPETNSNLEPKLTNYNSAIFEPRESNIEPDNFQPADYDAPLNYDPENYKRPYDPRNEEQQNYELYPSKQLVYNYSHRSHLDNLQNEGEVEILDVIYDDDDHEAQIIEAMNKQTLVMEKLANVIQNENRRVMKLSRSEKHFNELLDEVEEWNNKTSTTPKQKTEIENQEATTKETPSIISIVDETEIRNALKENPLVKRILKMAARKRKEYFDAVQKYYNITTNSP